MTEGQRGSEPKISMAGRNNKLDVRLEAPPLTPVEKIDLRSNSRQRGGSIFNSDYSFSQALPWSIALLMFAIAVVASMKAYKYARQHSPAIEAAFATAEEILARRIGSWRDRTIVEDNPTKVAEATSKTAELQRDIAEIKQAKFDQTP